VADVCDRIEEGGGIERRRNGHLYGLSGESGQHGPVLLFYPGVLCILL